MANSSASSTTPDVLICGAGAAGLALAVDFARRGVAFRIVEKLESPFAGSRGKGLQPRTLEIFEDLGVLDRIAAFGACYPPQRHHAADGGSADEVIEATPPTPAEPYPTPQLLPQFLTERVLRERLAELGGRVEFSVELTAFEQDGNGVTAHLRSGAGEETIHARYLIGADGGRSGVRHGLGVDFPGDTLGVRAIVADVAVPGLSRDAWHRFGPDIRSQVALCPLAGTELFQLQAPVPFEGEVDLSPEGLTRVLAKRSGRDDLVVTTVTWASAYTMSARLADRYRVGRVFLAGDAAHTHPPTGGQGLNTSIQDAYNLGWKLAAVLNGAPEALLDTYEAERRPIAAGMLGLATRLLDETIAGKAMRRGRETRQLDLGYAGGPLALETPERASGLAAGGRAPDAPLVGAGGQPYRLFNLMTGPHWTLVAYQAPAPALTPRPGLRQHRIADDGDLRDDHGAFHAAYAAEPGELFLIRPDGYVGAILRAEDAAGLEAYLARVGLGS